MDVEAVIALKEQQERHNEQMEEASQIYETNLAKAEQSAMDKLVAEVAAK